MDNLILPNFNHRNRFLEKQRSHKGELERQDQRIRNIVRLQACIRTVLCRTHTFKRITEEAQNNMPLVLQKQQELPPEKAAKMMSNVIYRMPYFFHAVLATNLRNYQKHWQYLTMLMTGLSFKKDARSVVVACVLQKEDFVRAELLKLVSICIRMLDAVADPTCIRFLQAYLEECEFANSSDRLKNLLKQAEFRATVIRVILYQSLSPQLLSMLLNHTVLQHINYFRFLNLEECIQLALKYTQVVTKEFLELPAINHPTQLPANFLRTNDINKALINYQQASAILEQTLLPIKLSPERLSFALLVNNLALQRYSSAVKDSVFQRFYKRKTIIETAENREQLEWVLHRSPQYSQFLSKIDPKLYSDKLLCILDGLLTSNKGEIKGLTATIFESLANIYMKILELFCDSFTSSLNSEASHKLISTLFGMLKDTDLRVSRSINRAIGKLFELFIVMLGRQFKLMDDYQFSNNSYPPEVLLNIIEFLLKQLALAVNQRASESEPSRNFHYLTELLSNIYQKNYRTKLLNPTVFIGDVHLNRMFQQCNFDNKQESLFRKLQNVPFIISLEYRYNKFLESLRESYVPAYDVSGTVSIERGREFMSAFNQIGKSDLNRRFQFEFLSWNGRREEGVDMGGPTKEFLNRSCRQVFNPTFGMFQGTPTNEVIPNPNSKFTLQHYQFAGSLVGKAMQERIALQPQFSGIFLNILLGEKNNLDDLQYLNKEIYANLMMLKYSKDIDIADLSLTFSVLNEYVDGNGRRASLTVELREDGRNIAVTQQNKIDFIMAYADYLVNQQIMERSQAFKKGMMKLVSGSTLKLFNHDELNRIISGSRREIDFKDLKLYVAYSEYASKDRTILMLWNVLEEFNQQQREKFLLFVTACSRPPLLGFRELHPKLRIVKVPDSQNLPTAHTCGNILKLPDYQNERKLRQKLLLAIEHNTGFGFA